MNGRPREYASAKRSEEAASNRAVGARVLPYSLPLAKPWRTAAGERRRREGAIVAVSTLDEVEGLGEAAPLPGRTEPLDRCLATLERAAAALRSGRPGLEEAASWLEGRLPELRPSPGGDRAARAALAAALLDLEARSAGVPLAAWLAARFRPGQPVATRVPVNASLPLAPTRDTVDAALAAVTEGFGCLKLKLGRAPGKDLERVRAVREAVGPGVSLRLDANGSWLSAEAPRWLDELVPFDIEYVEQPLAPGEDPEGRAAALAEMARLRASSPLPLAVDESASDASGARAALEAEAADLLILKPTVLGGSDVALELALEARRVGVDVVITSALEGVVGRLAALHTAAALGPGIRPCGLATGRFLASEVAQGDERFEAGALVVPEGPGLGARLP